MARYDHLPLRRLEGNLERRKRPGFGSFQTRNPGAHGRVIGQQLETVVEARKLKPKIAGIDPALILRISASGPIDEDTLARLGLVLLSSDDDKTLVLFAEDNELRQFQERVAAYRQGPQGQQKNAPYAGLVAVIDQVGEVLPIDRIGPVLRASGFADPQDFTSNEEEVFDVELWQPSENDVILFASRVSRKAEEIGGTVINEYHGKATTIVRIRCRASAVPEILQLPEVCLVDLPPVPDLPTMVDSVYAGVDQEPGRAPALDAVAIGIIDSGVSDGHPLLQPAVIAAFGVPEELGAADEKGHGTPVSGIALYGDVRARLEAHQFDMPFRIASARVVNARGRFDDKRVVAQQMEDAIRKLVEEHGCKVINVSLADDARPIGAKPTSWAAVLDQLAHELDIVVVVSAGNTDKAKIFQRYGEEICDAYPGLLLDDGNRILEPGSAVNVLTIGSISHTNGVSEDDHDLAGVRPITAAGQPSPFTRVGPGVGGMIKPDLVDYGGTAVLYGPELLDGKQRPTAGVLSLNNKYVERLFTTSSGTSFSAPIVSFKAAALYQRFPDATANLIRALLALSAEVPEAALECLAELDEDEILNVCGYGVSDVDRALSSDDDRVILFAEDTLALDRFAVYEVPIPDAFQTEPGERQIKVSLAFDPPVRHTRIDYAGVAMSFQLIRGSKAEEVFDHFRKWENEKDKGKPFKLANKFKCDLKPKQTVRERGTLQCARYIGKQDISQYGSSYFLVVRCESGWAEVEDQHFAVAVELRHESEIRLFERVRARVRVRA
jgi:subtilisin family serine protease